MHVNFIHFASSFVSEFEREIANVTKKFREQKIHCTLLYDPLDQSDPIFLDNFDAAFPLIDINLQGPELNASLNILCQWPRQLPINTVQFSPQMAIPSNNQQPVPPANEEFSISVIMRSRNASQTIAQALKALFSQNVKIDELFLIDSSSTDNTISIAEHYPVQIKKIAFQDYFPGKVLNQAMTYTKNEIVVFNNSDAVMLTPNSLINLIHPIKEPKVKASYARQIPRPDAYTWVKRDYEAFFPNSSIPPDWAGLSLSLATIRKSAWLERPFYTSAWGSEDIEWSTAMKQKGHIISYSNKSLVMHSHNYSLKGLYGRKFIEGEAEVFIFKKQYSFYSCIIDIVKSTLRDFFYYLKKRDFLNIPKIPILRAVYHWGFYRGYLHGKERLKKGISDPSRGQKEVLSRYE